MEMASKLPTPCPQVVPNRALRYEPFLLRKRWRNVLSTRVPGANRSPECRASFRILSTEFFNMSCATRSTPESVHRTDRASRPLFVCALAFLIGACSKTDEPFSRVTRAAAEADPNPGYVWFHRRPGQPLPGARYEAGFDVKAQFGLGVCRARHAGAMLPGRTYGQRCSLPIDGKEVIVDEFDALVARAGGLWHIEPAAAKAHADALLAGRDASGAPLHACVAVHVTGWLFKSHHGFQPGVYRDGKCEFAFDGDALTANEFFVLGTASPRKEKPLDLRSDGGTAADGGADAASQVAPGAEGSTAAVAKSASHAAGDAATDALGAADAAVDSAADATAEAAAAGEVPGMEPEPELPFPPAAPAACIQGEEPCPCERFNGCSRAGLCICRL